MMGSSEGKASSSKVSRERARCRPPQELSQDVQATKDNDDDFQVAHIQFPQLCIEAIKEGQENILAEVAAKVLTHPTRKVEENAVGSAWPTRPGRSSAGPPLIESASASLEARLSWPGFHRGSLRAPPLLR